MPRFSAVTFTDRQVAALKPRAGRRRLVFDAGEPGLGIRVGGAAKTWVFVYRVKSDPPGPVRFLTLGRYPALGLAKARKAARAARVQVDEGRDPAAARQAAKLGETFGELATEYLDKHAKTHKRSWGEDERILESELLPHWRDRKVKELTRREVRALLEAIAARPAPVMANRTWALINTIFNFAIDREWIEANPAARIKRQAETARDRVLTHDELRALWAALEAATAAPPARTARRAKGDPVDRVSPTIARGLQMLLWTAQRPGEVFQMRWEDLELPDDWQSPQAPVQTAWWTIPEAFSKNREAHRVPIGREALALLREAWQTAPSDNRWVFAGDAGASVALRAKKAAAVLSKALTFSFHRHDLRRTAASEMGAAGISRETIARVLNHVDRGPRVTRVYDRYHYDPEKRLALETWARRLTGILEARPAAVVLITRGRR